MATQLDYAWETEENYLWASSFVHCQTMRPNCTITTEEGNKYSLNVSSVLDISDEAMQMASLRSQKTIDGYINSIKYIHRLNGISLGGDVKRFLEDFTEGYKR